MRIVFDTNVLFAAFATRGLCDALLAACLQEHQIILSEYILAELSPHLRVKLKMADGQVDEIVLFLRQQSTIVAPTSAQIDFTDQDDLPVLGTAVAGQADVLVTGDAELQKLGRYERFAILSPRDLYDRLVREQ